MSETLHVTIDAQAVSVAETIAEAAKAVPFMVISDRLFAELVTELGGEQEATRHLIRVATKSGKPLAVNVEGAAGKSTTAIISPRGWTQERLRGWIGVKAEALSGLFGESTIREEA